MYNKSGIYLKGFTLLFLYEVNVMKKIILLVCLLIMSGLTYGNSLIGEKGQWNQLYALTSDTILYYAFGFINQAGGDVRCIAYDRYYDQKDASLEIISDGVSWGGTPPGIYNLNAANNYSISFTLTNITLPLPNSPNGGNIIIINKSVAPIQFLVRCAYSKYGMYPTPQGSQDT